MNIYTIDTLSSVDIQQSDKRGGSVVEIYKGVIYGVNFIIILFRKDIDNLFKTKI